MLNIVLTIVLNSFTLWYFVRVDFRDYFNIEPPTNEGNCDYDYLEVRCFSLVTVATSLLEQIFLCKVMFVPSKEHIL